MTLCTAQEITLYGRTTVSREVLTYAIVGCDMAIVILFVLNGVWIYHLTKEEERIVDHDNVETSDFSVRIKNIQCDEKHMSLDELRMKLENHIRTIVKDQP